MFPPPMQGIPDAGKRSFQIALNIVGESFERGHIDDLCLVPKRSLDRLLYQPVDRGEKGCERLPRTGWRSNKDVTAGLDRGPGFRLSFGWQRKGASEPGDDGRMKARGSEKFFRGRRGEFCHVCSTKTARERKISTAKLRGAGAEIQCLRIQKLEFANSALKAVRTVHQGLLSGV